nr:hypothetical protein CFP56_22976 [Quercus suber]
MDVFPKCGFHHQCHARHETLQWCMVGGDELEELQPWKFRRRAQFKREGSKGREEFWAKNMQRVRLRVEPLWSGGVDVQRWSLVISHGARV